MYSKIKDYSGTVKSYFDTSGEMKGALKEGDLDSLRKEYEVIVARIKSQYPNYRQRSERLFNQWIIKTTERIQRLYDFLTNDRYKHVIAVLQAVNGPRDLGAVNGYNDIGKAMFELNDSLPAPSLVRALYGQLTSSLENKSKELTLKIIEQIHDLFPDVKRLKDIEDLYRNIPPGNPPGGFPPDYPPDYPFKKPPKDEPPGDEPPGDEPPDSYVKDRALLEEKLIAVRRDIKSNEREIARLSRLINENIMQLRRAKERGDSGADDIFVLLSNQQEAYGILENDLNDLQDFEQELIDQLKSYSKSKPKPSQLVVPTSIDGDDFVDATDDIEDEPVPSLESLASRPAPARPAPAQPAPAPNTIEGLRKQLNNLKKDKTILEQWYNDPSANRSQKAQQKLKDEIDAVQDKIEDIEDEILDMRAAGTGFKKRRGRPKGSGISFKDNIDHAKGIQPVKKYHPFGKYFVNSHKLNNGNVLSIKSKSGTNIREYPSKTVSKNLGHVIKTIIGGGVPSWNDMEKLTNDEKDYLYKISKRAEFSDKITIPTPSKDQQEKDIHEFDVCKGEIMAGNDSKELIKKFKLLIIKLSKNGSIPKREASEVMQELLELGY
jgi:hypothetical protein